MNKPLLTIFNLNYLIDESRLKLWFVEQGQNSVNRHIEELLSQAEIKSLMQDCPIINNQDRLNAISFLKWVNLSFNKSVDDILMLTIIAFCIEKSLDEKIIFLPDIINSVTQPRENSVCLSWLPVRLQNIFLNQAGLKKVC